MTTCVSKQVALTLQASDVKNAVKSFTLSKKYVKRLVKISVLNIIHNRIAIPQEEFISKQFEKVPYMIFKRKSNNEYIRMYHAVIHGIIDAIEKDYLKEIIIKVLRKGTKEVIEMYSIKLKYAADKDYLHGSPEDADELKEVTKDFLGALHEIPGRKWPENSVDLSIEVNYLDNVPSDYEPPNFEPADKNFPAVGKLVDIAMATTGFHKIIARAKGRNFSDSESIRTTTPMSRRTTSRVTTPMSKVIDDEFLNEFTHEIELIEEEEYGRKPSGSNKRRKKTYDTDDIAAELSKYDGFVDTESRVSILCSEDYTNCICKLALGGNYELVKCTQCTALVHVVCHFYLHRVDVDEGHFVCFACEPGEHDVRSLEFIRMLKIRLMLYSIKQYNQLPNEMSMFGRIDNRYLISGYLEAKQLSKKVGNEIVFDKERINIEILSLFKTDSQYMV